MRRALVAVALLGVGVGCGYRFTPMGGGLPEDVRRLCAPVFVNRTGEPGLEAHFTQALREQLLRAGALAEAGACEARIEGEVVGVGSGPTIVSEPRFDPLTSFVVPGGGERLASYRASAAAVLRLVKEGRVLAETYVSAVEDFLPGADTLEAEANRYTALRRLSEALMREGFDRLATRW